MTDQHASESPRRWRCDGCEREFGGDDPCYNNLGELDPDGFRCYCEECNINRQAARREAAEEGER